MMMDMLQDISFGFALPAVVALGAWVGYQGIGRVFSSGVYTTKNAAELLLSENVGAWNAFRRANPGWRPDLRGLECSGRSLQDVDFRYARLDGADFRGARIDGADLSGAQAPRARFDNASATRAVFNDADLTAAAFGNAFLNEASFINANVATASFDEKQSPPGKPAMKPESHNGSVALAPSQLAALTPAEFKVFVTAIFARLGYTVAAAGNEGADIVLRQQGVLGLTTTVVQLQRVSDAVRVISKSALAALEDTRHQYRAVAAVFVTNGGFSTAALDFVAASANLHLIDGNRLSALSRQVNAKSGPRAVDADQ